MTNNLARVCRSLANLVWFLTTLGIGVHAFFFTQAHNLYLIYDPAIRLWWTGEDIYVLQADYFRYSPLFAVFLAPLVILPDSWASLIWKVLNIGIYFVGLKSAWRHLSPVPEKPALEAAFLMLALPGSLHSMANGQANCAMVGLLLWGLSLAARQRWTGSAALVALGVMVKSYSLALALLVAAWKPRELLPRLIVALAVCLALPFLAQSPGYVANEYASWVHHLRESEGINRDRQRALDQVCALCNHPLDSRTFTLLGMAAGGCVLVWTWLIQRAGADARVVLLRTYQGFALWVALFGPATEGCTYIVVAPAVAQSCVEAYHPSPVWWKLALLWTSLFLMGPAVTDFVGPMRMFADTHGSQPIGALLYALVLAIDSIHLFMASARIETAPAVHSSY
ncbi:MAG: DUF2029 domain-containing protein [Planctomycetes bacterium]|nr:DUF2029 domain-containing protein [Planctomycetota bacterium]